MSVEEGREALHAQLVRAQDVRHAVCFEEFVDDAGAEGVACASGGVSVMWGGKEEMREGKGRTWGILRSPLFRGLGLTRRGRPLDPHVGSLWWTRKCDMIKMSITPGQQARTSKSVNDLDLVYRVYRRRQA